MSESYETAVRWPNQEGAKECILKFGSHQLHIHQWGGIGYVEFCERCGCGEWHPSPKKMET